MNNKNNFKVTKKTLPNEMRVLFYKMPWANSVTAQLWVAAGPRFEPEATSGLAHFLEHLFFDGTKSYPSNRKLNEVVESFGGDIDAVTYKEYVIYQSKMPHQNQTKALEFLNEAIFSSLFRKQAIEKERGIIKQEVKKRVDDMESYTWDFLLKSLWTFGRDSLALSRNTLGSEASIKKIQKSDLLDFKREMYIPENMFLVIAGNFKEKLMTDSIKKIFYHPAGGSVPVLEKIDFQRHSQRRSRVFIEKRNNSKQAYITLSFLTDTLPSQPQMTTLKVLDMLLQKRIFDLFVYQTGLSYGASTYPWIFKDHALENITIEVAPEKVAYAVSKILKEIKTVKIDTKSIAEATNSLKKYLFLSLADTDKLAEFIGKQEWYTGHVKSPKEIIKEIDGVKIEQIKKLKNKLFRHENALLTIVGNVNDSPKSLERTLKHILSDRQV